LHAHLTTAHTTLSQLSSQHWIKLVIGGTTFVAIYLITTPLTRAIDKSDINNLKELKPISHILNLY